MQVCEIMKETPVCCFPTDSALDAAQLMRNHDIGALPVVEKGTAGKLLGIVTDRDLCIQVVAEGREPKHVKVSQCMTSAPICCGPRDDIRYALLLMREHQIRRIPVIDAQHHIGGIVTFANIINSHFDPFGLVETIRATCAPSHQALEVSHH